MYCNIRCGEESWKKKFGKTKQDLHYLTMLAKLLDTKGLLVHGQTCLELLVGACAIGTHARFDKQQRSHEQQHTLLWLLQSTVFL